VWQLQAILKDFFDDMEKKGIEKNEESRKKNPL
jgi:hypothetical protein